MKVILSTVVCVFLLATHRANAAAPDTAATNAPGNPVIVRGDGFEIRRSDLDQVLDTAKARYPGEELPADAPVHALTQLIEIQLVLSKATDEEKAEGAKQADEKLASITNEFSPEEIARRLRATHMTKDDLRRKFYQEMTAQLSLARQLGIQVTDADARKLFDAHPGAYDRPPRAHVREILLLTTSDYRTSAAPPLPESVIQAKRERIGELLNRARAGEDFEALAKQYNEDPISKAVSGELSFARDQMEFGDLAFSMQSNQISGVLTNEDGFRIFQLLNIIPAQKAEFAAVAGQIRNGLIGEQKRRLAPAYLTQLKKRVKILDAGLKAAVAANDAAIAADSRRAAEAQAAASAEANTPAQKAAEAKVFGAAADPSSGKQQ